MIYLGIDCGINGALVLLSGRQILEKMPMPVIQNGKRKEIDIEQLNAIFDSLDGANTRVIIENPGGHAPSASGLRSMTYSYAVVHTLAVVRLLPYYTFLARQWQKEYWIKPKGSYDTKAYALSVANDIWLDQDWRRTPRCKKAFDGFVDAALIAEYGRRLEL